MQRRMPGRQRRRQRSHQLCLILLLWISLGLAQGQLFGGLPGRRGGGGNNNNNPLAARRPLEPPSSHDDATLAAVTSGTVIAGKVRWLWKKLKHVNLAQLHLGMNGALDWSDLVWLGALGYLTEPLARLVYQLTHREKAVSTNVVNGDDDNNAEYENSAAFALAREGKYKKTWLFRIASSVGQVGRLIGLVYVTDIATLAPGESNTPFAAGVMTRRFCCFVSMIFMITLRSSSLARSWCLFDSAIVL